MSGGTRRVGHTRVERTPYFVAPAVNKKLASLVSIVYDTPSKYFLCSYRSTSISTTIVYTN